MPKFHLSLVTIISALQYIISKETFSSSFSSIGYRYSHLNWIKITWLLCIGITLDFTVFLIQFFQWADVSGSVGIHHGGSRIRLTDPAGVTAHLRQHRVMFYCQSQFLQKSLENILGHFKNVSSTCHGIISLRSQ